MIEAAVARFVELLSDRDILFVIDDVWSTAHLKPFLQGGKRCARLITTRNDRILPSEALRIPVDAMSRVEAIQLLIAGIADQIGPVNKTQELNSLAARLGDWPLLLVLVNGVLRERMSVYKQSLSDALTFINRTLDKKGITAFDTANIQDRTQTVAEALKVSFELLRPEEFTRYKELAIFSEDTGIPLDTVKLLWSTTGGLDELDTEELCQQLYRLSLLLRFDLSTRTLRLHDVVRTYLRQEMGSSLAVLNRQLLDAYKLERGRTFPPRIHTSGIISLITLPRQDVVKICWLQ